MNRSYVILIALLFTLPAQIGANASTTTTTTFSGMNGYSYPTRWAGIFLAAKGSAVLENAAADGFKKSVFWNNVLAGQIVVILSAAACGLGYEWWYQTGKRKQADNLYRQKH